MQVTIAPGATVGATATVKIDPDAGGLTVSNLITTGVAGATAAIERRRLPGTYWRLLLAAVVGAGLIGIGGGMAAGVFLGAR